MLDLQGGAACGKVETNSDGAWGTQVTLEFACPGIVVIELEEVRWGHASDTGRGTPPHTPHPHSFLPRQGTTFALGGEELVIPAGLGVKIVGRGAGATIDGEGRSRIVTATSGSALFLENVHLINGNVTDGNGGGINVNRDGDSSITLQLTNVTMSDMYASGAGGCVYLFDTDTFNDGFVFRDVTMERCTAGDRGGGVFAHADASLDPWMELH